MQKGVIMIPQYDSYNIRESLRKLEIKIMDLAKLLGISRPTLYKIIEEYERGEREKIEPSYLALFDYIQRGHGSKNSVIAYIVQNIITVKSPNDTHTLQDMIHKLFNPPNEIKEAFITSLLQKSPLDSLLPYLVECHTLLQKETLSQEDNMRLQPLHNLYQCLGLEITF